MAELDSDSATRRRAAFESPRAVVPMMLGLGRAPAPGLGRAAAAAAAGGPAGQGRARRSESLEQWQGKLGPGHCHRESLDPVPDTRGPASYISTT